MTLRNANDVVMATDMGGLLPVHSKFVVAMSTLLFNYFPAKSCILSKLSIIIINHNHEIWNSQENVDHKTIELMSHTVLYSKFIVDLLHARFIIISMTHLFRSTCGPKPSTLMNGRQRIPDTENKITVNCRPWQYFSLLSYSCNSHDFSIFLSCHVHYSNNLLHVFATKSKLLNSEGMLPLNSETFAMLC